MPGVADIFRLYGPAYLEQFGNDVPLQHRKVVRSVSDCRTERMGAFLYRCESCGRPVDLFLSCGNRHCPSCQHEKARAWLASRTEKLLPVAHFMVTFTVPACLRDFLRSHQKVGYAALFWASSETLRRLASESTYFPGDLPGFFGVLHTWGRTLQYHPHIHYVVAGGAFDSQTHTWYSSSEAFYLPVRVMSQLVKSLFYRRIQKTGLLPGIPEKTWQQPWNVNSRPVGDGARSVRYLSAYVFRTGICDTRIVAIQNGRVVFRYCDSRTGATKLAHLSAFEFIRRFLQHVLPRGFVKIRTYGFLHPSSSIPLPLAIALLEAWRGLVSVARRAAADIHPRSPFCPQCHGALHYLRFVAPAGRATAGYG